MICAIFMICRLLSVTFVMYFNARNKDLCYYYYYYYYYSRYFKSYSQNSILFLLQCSRPGTVHVRTMREKGKWVLTERTSMTTQRFNNHCSIVHKTHNNPK